MRAASESRGGEAGTAEVEVEEGRETEAPAVAAQHRRAENRGRIEESETKVTSPPQSRRKMVIKKSMSRPQL